MAEALQKLPEDVKNVSENADLAVDFFDLQADLNGMDFLPIKNTTCITRHCTGYIAGCLADEMCRATLGCNSQCGGDTSCQFTCSESYQSEAIDKLFQCLYVDYECVTLPPPDEINNATCRNPATTATTVDISGVWYIVRGFNPLYDCFDCQK